MSNNRLCCLKTVLLATSMLTLGSANAAFGQGADSETVVVTGTRLSTEGFVAPTPVTSVGSADIANRAPGNISDVLSSIPSFRQSVGNTEVPRGNAAGENELDLRSLGVNRTLVLLDGNRIVPTNLDGSVNTNSIPVLLINHIDTVTGGASAAYGSDAVAGVVNFVLKDRMDGIVGTVAGGIAERGDNVESDYDIAGGTNFFNDRLHLVGSLERTRVQGIGVPASRPDQFGNQSVCLLSPTSAQRTAGGLPANLLEYNCTYSQQAASTLVTGGLTAAGTTSTAISNITFGPGGTVLPFNIGIVSSSLMYNAAPNPTDPSANPNTNLVEDPMHAKVNIYTKATFDITNDISAWTQLLWASNQAYNTVVDIQNNNIIIPITGPNANPYVPASLQAAATAAGLTALLVGRNEEATGGQNAHQTDITSRVAFGFQGKVFGDWAWDLTYTHGQTSTKNFARSVVLEGNYLESIFAVNGPGGTVVCGAVASNPNLQTGSIGAGRQGQVQPGCQPFNIFGPTIATYNTIPMCFNCAGIPSALINSPTASQASVNYWTHVTPWGAYYQQDDVAVNLRGSPFATWAGPVQLAVGFEHRREGGRAFSDAFSQGNYANFNSGSVYNGSFFDSEGYIEAGVPLLKNEFLAENVNVDIAFRETGYGVYGVIPTYKVGLDWQINDDWRIRANRSRDAREPSIVNLFAQSFLNLSATNFADPITHTNVTEYNHVGGNPNLKPENADSTTVGIVYTPTDGWFTGLNASVDWYQVNINSVITTVTNQVIAQACAAGNAAYCALVHEGAGPAGALVIDTVPANLSVQKTSGMDFEFSYSTPLDALDLPGSLTARWLTTFTDYNVTQGITRLETAGAAQGQAKYISNINLTYVLGPSATNFQIRYASDILADATLIGPGQTGYSPTLSNSVNINQFPSSYYIDLAENYDFYDNGNLKLTGFLNVNNILDKQPPGGMLAWVAFIQGGSPYDIIGRAFKLGIRFKY